MRIVKLVFSFFIIIQSHAQITDFEHVDFSKADSIALNYKSENLKNIPDLAYKLTSQLDTDVEKFRSIFKWIAINLSNDYVLYVKNKRKRYRFKEDSLKLDSWNTKFRKLLFRKMVSKKTTICTGYAYLLKELSDIAGLSCEIVHGFGKTSTTLVDAETIPNHSWNVIKLNGNWYLADPTWASGIPDPETNRFKFYFNEGYFLAHPKLYSVNHFPLEKKWSLLNENAPSFETFIDAPIIYGAAYTFLTAINTPKQMHNEVLKNDRLQFEYQLLKPVAKEDVVFMIDNGFSNRDVKPSSISISKNNLKFDYRFNATGFYDVHVLIKDQLISTHTVRVKN